MKLKENRVEYDEENSGIYDIPTACETIILSKKTDNLIDNIANSIKPNCLSNLNAMQNIAEHYHANVKLNKDLTAISFNFDNICELIVRIIDFNAKHIGHRLIKHNADVLAFNGKYYAIVANFSKLIKDCLSKFKLLLEYLKYDIYETRLFKMVPNYKDVFQETDFNMLISMKNCIVGIKNNKLVKMEHSPDYFVCNYLDYNYDESAQCPIFNKYLDRVLPNKDTQKVLQEFIGYCFTSGFSLDAVLLLYGKGQDGKSVLQKILKHIFGKDNISSATLSELLESMSTRYACKNKLVNMSGEIGHLKEQHYDVLKKMASNEEITISGKYIQDEFITWNTKMIFNANKLPTPENTGGFFRRFIIIPFKNSITGAEKDPNIHNKIIDNELSGVFNWVINGMVRLIENGYKFSTSEEINQQQQEYESDTDTFLSFLDHKNYNPSKLMRYSTKLIDIRKDYAIFCKDLSIRPRQLQSILTTLKKHKFILQKIRSSYVVYHEPRNGLY